MGKVYVFSWESSLQFRNNGKSIRLNSVTSRRNFGTTFSAGGPQYQQNFIDLYHFAHFQPLLFSSIRCSVEQNIRKLIVYCKNLSENNNFMFLFFIFGDIFWASMFERYHFQSGCDPVKLRSLINDRYPFFLTLVPELLEHIIYFC